MKLLLDTHVFLWYITADTKLPLGYQSAIQDPANEVFLSVASIWEAVIKFQLGKLPLPAAPEEFLPQQRIAHAISSSEINEATISHLAKLPPLHRDPFDRLLVAQARQHGLFLATVDSALIANPVAILPEV